METLKGLKEKFDSKYPIPQSPNAQDKIITKPVTPLPTRPD